MDYSNDELELLEAIENDTLEKVDFDNDTIKSLATDKNLQSRKATNKYKSKKQI